MVVLVLDDTGHVAFEVFFAAFARFVGVFNVNFRLTGHILVDVGQAQATLVEGEVRSRLVGDDRVDESALVDLYIVVGLLKRLCVNDKYG